MRALFTALAWIAIGTLILAVLFQSTSDRFGFPSCWGIQYANYGHPGPLRPAGLPFTLESFENQEVKIKENISGIPDSTDSKSGNPATAEPKYSLLEDSLSKKMSPGTLSANSCFQSDFLAQSSKVGNYIQRTNNIRHATPDSCSAPLTELVDSFYTNQVLP